MAIQAAAVEILIDKARFEPQVALGIAEAIEVSLVHAQVVTVPILDARLEAFKAETRILLMSLENKLSAELGGKIAGLEVKMAELEVKMERIKAELVRWVFLVMLGNVALSAGATAILNSFKHL